MSLQDPYPAERHDDPEFESLVAHVCTRPGMWVIPQTVRTVCAFFQGFDLARGGGPLLGLQQWLVIRCDGGNNLYWTGLIEDLVPADEDEKRRIAKLGEVLAEFFEYRHQVGITKVFYDYAQWLLSQSWYDGPLRKERGTPGGSQG